MSRLTLRRTAYGTALGVVVFHVLSHLLFGADIQWRSVGATAVMVSGGAIVGVLIRDRLRAGPEDPSTPEAGSSPERR